MCAYSKRYEIRRLVKIRRKRGKPLDYWNKYRPDEEIPDELKDDESSTTDSLVDRVADILMNHHDSESSSSDSSNSDSSLSK